MTFIDFGYCFNAGEWTFPDAPLRGVYTMNRVYEGVTGWKSFEPTLSRAQSMTLDEIRACTAGMPAEWYRQDADGLERIIESLCSRRTMISELIAAFRRSGRNPFPNWKD